MKVARTIAPRHMTRRELARGRELYPVEEHPQRPRTRAECLGGPRPCPWCSCRYHLAIDVGPKGSIRLALGHEDVLEMPETCALDVADRGAHTLDELVPILRVSRQMVANVERAALDALERERPVLAALAEDLDTVGAP